MKKLSFAQAIMRFINGRPAPVKDSLTRRLAIDVLISRFESIGVTEEDCKILRGIIVEDKMPNALIDYLILCPPEEFLKHHASGIAAMFRAQTTSATTQ